MANPVLEGLAQFNQSLQSLAQQRVLTGASQTVQQIQNSELNDQQKQMALQHFGQQFALNAMSTGIDPSSALATAHAIGPARPLIQSGLQAAVYGTPEEQSKVKAYDEEETAQKIKVKQAEDDRLYSMQDKIMKHQVQLAQMNNASKQEIAELKQANQQQTQVAKVGKDFRNDKLLNAHSELQTQLGAFNQILDNPNGLDASTASDMFHQFVEKSVSREADIKRVEGAQGIVNQIETTLAKAKGEGKVLKPETVARLKAAGAVLGNKLSSAADVKRSGYRNQITASGGDPDLFDPLKFLDQQKQQQASPMAPASAPTSGLSVMPGGLQLSQ